MERTGIGLVRRGEVVVAAGDGSAEIAPTAATAPRVSLEFAVTVEVGPSVAEVAELASDLALRRLREALAARTAG